MQQQLSWWWPLFPSVLVVPRKMIICLYVRFTPSIITSLVSFLDFRCAPRNVSVLVGSQVRFQCQARWAATSVRWRFNDRGWGLLDHPYASMSTTSDSSWNSSVYSRGLTVEREHNSSRVQCVLTLDLTTGAQTVYSDEAVVIVRGKWLIMCIYSRVYPLLT